MFLFTFCITIIYAIYHLIFGLPVIFKKKQNAIGHVKSASIVTCQFNEEANIPFFIKNIQNQIQPNLELIIVDDYSSDQSFNLANRYTNNDKLHVKVYNNTLKKGKKHAQKYAYSLASNNEILLTDMDCKPASNSWSKIMCHALQDQNLVLGHAPFYKRGSWLNKLQRYDNAWIAFQYFGFALNRIPYMGVGRNMAIRKNVYDQNKHKIKGDHLVSGDDDLLVQALGSDSVSVMLNPDSFMYSEAESSYSAWLRQKRRQVSTSALYKWFHKILLVISAGISILTPCSLLLMLIVQPSSQAILLLLLYLFILFGVKGLVYAKLKERDLVLLLPILEVMYSIHLLILSSFVLLKKSNRWK